MKLVGRLAICEAVLCAAPSPFPLAFGDCCGVLNLKPLAQCWTQYKSSFNVRGYFFSEGRRKISLNPSPASRSAFEAVVSLL